MLLYSIRRVKKETHLPRTLPVESYWDRPCPTAYDRAYCWVDERALGGGTWATSAMVAR